ncbi:FtsW/RodA/SpoVE family cell cycle protein [Paenibacillus sp. SC116]|uniref:FtsW/RodA/SpoVE family cell cycle protein n=1 Tax=Paenibacillus sp. SC116 TaxID=2968986 RepID=UPI00215B3CEC|nr:FtsW/RodA/SpoVE family cell cycle protein [Paenibacillus sp. SC116]MCR8845958.1 FtsW/RodA/SpoVE family cell cycle protein [Paenibacillus sp. SC116]
MSAGIKGFVEHPLIVQYLECVCGQVKAKDVHEDIRNELLCHIQELADECSYLNNMTLDETVSYVLKQMGNPEEVGRGLHIAHKPKPEWSVIALVAGMVGIALIILLNLAVNFSIKQGLIYGFIGISVMIALYFFDYRKLLRFSWPLYLITLAVLVVTQIFGIYAVYFLQDDMSSSQWDFFYMVYAQLNDLSPFLFLISFAGILQLHRQDQQRGEMESRFVDYNVIVCALLPILVYSFYPGVDSFFGYCVGLVVLLLLAGRRKLLLLFSGSGALLMGLIMLIGGTAKGSHWIAINSILEQYRDYFVYGLNQGPGTVSNFSMKLLESAGMWGQGFGLTKRSIDMYPRSSEFQLSFTIHSLGWVFGVIVIICAILFIKRVLRMGTLLKDGYARGLVTGLITVLSVDFIANILLCLNIYPFADTLPLMNWSYLTVVFDFAVVGLMLSVYRRKDMYSHSQLSRPIEK